MKDQKTTAPSRTLHPGEANRRIKTVSLSPRPSPSDYRAAMHLAKEIAGQHLDSPMLIAWYDADRDFESPQHTGECHLDTAVPGYIAYARHRGANLKIDMEGGRFVFFYLNVDI